MNVAHLLLGRSWLYDNIVKHYGHNNTYKLTHNKKTILLIPAKPASSTRPVAESSASNTLTQRLQSLTHKHFEKESVESKFVSVLVVADSFTMLYGPSSTHYLDVSSLLDEFRDIILDELLDVLPPLRDHLLETSNMILT